MTDYEVLIMLDPELAEKNQQEIVDRVHTLVTEGGGSWDAHVPWGKRRLAYEINHRSEGYYHLATFSAKPETLNEISRVLKIDDGVLRHLAVRRVKGSSTTAPASISLGSERPAETEPPAETDPPAETEPPEEAAPAGDSESVPEDD